MLFSIEYYKLENNKDLDVKNKFYYDADGSIFDPIDYTEFYGIFAS